MFNVRQILRNNNATFYDFDTRQRRSQTPRAVVTCAVGLIAALVCPNVSDNLLAGFLAVQSILLGFTFNVMFFLLGNRETVAPKLGSLEAELRAERLSDLYRELFYNVSYFNMIAIASIIVATALLLPVPEVPKLLHGMSMTKEYVQWLKTSTLPTFGLSLTRTCAMFIFYTLAIEVIFSISRVIGRTSFYFERKVANAPTP